MGRFAHLADIHIGAWRESLLAEQNMSAFRQALERCKEKAVDFIIISGDLFDGNIPNLEAVREAADLLREVRDSGIRIYVTYGSHDFSPTSTSIIDILASAGLFTKIISTDVIQTDNYQKIRLKFFEDKATGAKIVGIYGRKNGLELAYYEMLDKEYLETEPGYKIFVFHSAIDELIPNNQIFSDCIPLSLFPKDFDYYAGGHIHRTIIEKRKDYGTIAYPGTLFGYRYTDLEDLAHYDKRGFFIVDFDDNGTKVFFEQLILPEVVMSSFDATGQTPRSITDQLNSFLKKLNCKEKIVLIKFSGTLVSGKPKDIKVNELRQALEKKGALFVRINRGSLLGPEDVQPVVTGRTREEIEESQLLKMTSKYIVDPAIQQQDVRDLLTERFSGDQGLKTAKSVLKTLEDEKRENERSDDFESRIMREAYSILGVGDQ
jgi:hypothetical protein